ncbi:3' 5'-cyclic adenosine monophosphate phosphodiesterase CpdA, partial [termite gut metagenome]
MKKLLLLCFTCAWSCLQLSYAQSSPLKFNSNGKFKIVQFTDLHYIYDNPGSDIALERVNEVVDAEKPDLIIVTGDVIYGKPADKSMRAVLDVLAKKKTPFVVLFGNHDDEFGLSRSQLFDIIKSYPYNVTTTVEGLSGIGNCIFSLKGTNGKDEAILYCLDSHAYSSIEGI